jgi:dTDP-glucose 4,6-dehydratase
MTKKILITGATGFIGSHLAERCVELGHDVRAFDRYNPNNNWGWLEHSIHKSEIDVQLGDIRDYSSVLAAMQGCSAVFHLAALVGIPYSYESPLSYVRTNIEGTYNVLEAAKTLGLEQVIITSTSEVYGTARYTPIDEAHPLTAQSPYAATKIAADNLALSYFRSYGLPVKIARPFNTYGPRQSARAVIPTIISQLLAGHNFIELGNLMPTRDFTFVTDTVEGFLAISAADQVQGGIVNIGTGSEVSMGGLANTIARMCGRDVEVVQKSSRQRPGTSEVDRLLADTTKITSMTNWKPSVDLDQGLQKTIEWFKYHPEFYKAAVYTV